MSLKYDPSANNKPANASSLYLDNAGYKQQQDNINNHENAQKLDVSAFSAQEEVSGTECVGLLIEHWKDVAGAGDKFRDFGTGVVNEALSRQQKSIGDVDNANANSVPVEIASMNENNKYIKSTNLVFESIITPKPFDDIGKYGADQSGPESNIIGVWKDFPLDMNKVNTINEIKKNPGLYDKYFYVLNEKRWQFIKQIPEFKDKSISEIYAELYEMKTSGCTYMPVVNFIFDAYQDNKEEFEKRSGFPMVGDDNELNYELLQIAYFNQEKNKVYLDEPYGIECYAEYKEIYYEEHPDEYEKKYGRPLYLPDGKEDPKHFELCLNEAKEAQKAGIKEMRFDIGYSPAASEHSVINRGSHFCKTNQVLDIRFEDMGHTPTDKQLQEVLQNGGKVVFTTENYVLEDYVGNSIAKSSSGHQMIITGITADGRYIVSTWGRKLFYDPKKNSIKDPNQNWFYASYYSIPKVKINKTVKRFDLDSVDASLSDIVLPLNIKSVENTDVIVNPMLGKGGISKDHSYDVQVPETLEISPAIPWEE
ncbi:hypothetical protein D6856_14460 [Butyrivibrio sp. XB500-5]|uniref:hypothetical protein n=1 Tax=Butyrivibrio sp. XB500-5 TaxID=2364880 RepID=UPI000EAA5EEC|nr:hypothetical protein [Butyrivibrio sp. XB500-5]RKM56697.1 hypothetical protein D6856_14460 [Butyrivibrio sp. XB500-5]